MGVPKERIPKLITTSILLGEGVEHLTKGLLNVSPRHCQLGITSAGF
jgi:hypothetical protein